MDSVGGLGTKNLLPFVGVEFDQKIEKGGQNFHVLTYRAYNAMGLIGTEFNGVAVCSIDRKNVVCANIECRDTGYFGISPEQTAMAEKLCAMPWDEFKAFLNSHPNRRYDLE